MEVPGKLAFCDLCKNVQNKLTEAEGLCAECDVYMCQDCFKGHLLQKLCMNHVLSPVVGRKKKQAQERVKLGNCKLHQEEIVKYYCRLHDVIACVDCVVVDHRQCNVEFIRDLAKSVQEDSDYKDILRTIQQLEAEKNAHDNQCRQNRYENTALVDKAVDSIRKFRKELNDYLDNAEKEIIDEAQKLSTENKKKMSDLEEKITSINHKISALTDSLDPKSCPDEILFTRLIECKPQVQQVENTLSEITDMIDIKSFIFVPAESLKDILKKRQKIGCLKADYLLASKSNRRSAQTTSTDIKPIYSYVSTDVPTQTETGSQISKQEQANLSQESKASKASAHESAATKYNPPDPRAHGFNVGTRVYYIPYTSLTSLWFPSTVTKVYPDGFVDVKLDDGEVKSRVHAGAEGTFQVRLK